MLLHQHWCRVNKSKLKGRNQGGTIYSIAKECIVNAINWIAHLILKRMYITHTHNTFSFRWPLLVCSTTRSTGGGGRGGAAPPPDWGGPGQSPPVPVYVFPSDCVTCIALCHLLRSTTLCCTRVSPQWCVGVASTIHGKQIGGSASFWMRGTPLLRGSFCALRPLPSLAVGWWRWAIRTWDAGQPRVRDAGPPKRPRPDVAIPCASR